MGDLAKLAQRGCRQERMEAMQGGYNIGHGLFVVPESGLVKTNSTTKARLP